MVSTRSQARDEMFQLLLDEEAALKALDPALAAEKSELEFRWQGIETPDEVSDAARTMAGKFWTRAVSQVVLSRQSAHMMTDEPDGSPACWQTNGQLIIQVFAPRNVVNSYNIGDLLAGAIARIYRNAETNSGVWFRDSTAKEVLSEPSFWRWNVTVEFQYDERN